MIAWCRGLRARTPEFSSDPRLDTARVESARAEPIARGTGGLVRSLNVERLRGARYIPGTSIGKPAADKPDVRTVADTDDEAGRNGLGFAGQTVPSAGSEPSNRYRTT